MKYVHTLMHVGTHTFTVIVCIQILVKLRTNLKVVLCGTCSKFKNIMHTQCVEINTLTFLSVTAQDDLKLSARAIVIYRVYEQFD